MRRALLTTLAAGSACGLASVAQAQFPENFDATTAGTLPAGWSATGSGAGLPWAVVSDQSNSAPNSVFTNDRETLGSQFLTMPNINAIGPVTIDLRRRFQTESTFDGWVIEASINGGTYANIGAGAFQMNGYNSTISTGFSSAIGGQQAFSGTATTWTQSVAVIPANNGDVVSLRIHMATDTSVSSIGVWLDDINVTTAATAVCCKPDGTCDLLSPSACSTAGGVFSSAASCATAACPQPGACCLPAGTCSDGQLPAACVAAGGIYQGAASLCSGVTCVPFHGEVEPNESKATATPVTFAAPGAVIMGTTTGSSTAAGAASLDQFLITTPAAAPGVYRNRLALTTGGTAGHVGTIRGWGQVAAPAGMWPGPVGAPNTTDTAIQTSSTATTPARMNQWFGFGKEEKIYYRVTGTTTTTGTYSATWTRDPVTVTNLGSFQAGMVNISTFGQGHTTDTDLWVYDGNFNALNGFGNDDESVNGGTPGTGATTLSFLRREYPAGTYYLALSNFQLANNMGSPCDDDFRTGTLLDFPDALANSSTSANVNVAFAITDSAGTQQFAATRPAAYDVLFFQFDVTGTVPTGACCKPDGTCSELSNFQCLSLGAGHTFQGNGTTCATATCPQPGACCAFNGTCSFVLQSLCTGSWQAAPSCASVTCPPPPPVVYANCNLSTGATSLSGAPAPAGSLWSECADGDPPNQAVVQNTTAGFGASGALRLADDFVVPAGGLHIAYIKFPIYTTGATTVTTTGVTLQILDGPPNAGGTPVFGDTTTNRLANAEFSNIYRVFNTHNGPACAGTGTAPGTTRRVQWAYAAVNQTLPAGTYWLNWNFTGGTFAPPSTEADAVGRQCTGVNNNGLQFNAAWVPANDAGQGCSPVAVQLDHYFEVLGTVPTQACYANCDNSTQPPVLNVQDFSCFLTRYAAGESYANCDDSTQAPVLNVQDFSCFLTKYAAGC